MSRGSKSFVLATLVALCLTAVPALSMPFGNGDHTKGPIAGCNGNNSSGCQVMMGQGGDHGMRMCQGGMAPCGAGFNGPWGGFDQNSSAENSSVKVVALQRTGKGFATSADQYHAIDLRVFGTFSLDKEKLSGLISENKTLGQIEKDIQAELNSQQSAGKYNGSLMLGQDMYVLRSINWENIGDNNATLKADVAGPLNLTGINNITDLKTAMDNAPEAGQISINIADHEKSLIGQGQLAMKGGNTYNLLLNMGPSGKMMGFYGHSKMGILKDSRMPGQGIRALAGNP